MAQLCYVLSHAPLRGQGVHQHSVSVCWQCDAFAAAKLHLIDSRREELDDGEVLARPLHGLPRGPVVERPLDLDVVAAVTPCSSQGSG